MADKNDALAVQESGALAVPDYFKAGDRRGTEDIQQDDIQIPRLALAQDTSKQTKKQEPEYIPGLEVGHFFNSLTGENFGPGPLYFYILRRDKPRYVEFIPRSEGGGIRDPHVPEGDPRTEFGENGEPPIATKFYDFLVLLDPVNLEDPLSTLIALSLKSTGLKKARALNGLIMLRNRPIFSGRYELRSIDEKNKKGNYKNFSFKNAGWAGSVELGEMLASAYESLKVREDLVIHTDAAEPDPAEGDISFDPEKM